MSIAYCLFASPEDPVVDHQKICVPDACPMKGLKAGIHRKRDALHLTVPATDLQTIQRRIHSLEVIDGKKGSEPCIKRFQSHIRYYRP